MREINIHIQTYSGKLSRILNRYWNFGYIQRCGKHGNSTSPGYYYKLNKKGVRTLNELETRVEMGLDLNLMKPNPKKIKGDYMWKAKQDDSYIMCEQRADYKVTQNDYSTKGFK